MVTTTTELDSRPDVVRQVKMKENSPREYNALDSSTKLVVTGEARAPAANAIRVSVRAESDRDTAESATDQVISPASRVVTMPDRVNLLEGLMVALLDVILTKGDAGAMTLTRTVAVALRSPLPVTVNVSSDKDDNTPDVALTRSEDEVDGPWKKTPHFVELKMGSF